MRDLNTFLSHTLRQYFVLLFLVAFASMDLAAQQVAKSEQAVFALVNARIHTISNGVVSGTLVMENGRILDIGSRASIPRNAQVIDCAGLDVYPGMIDAGTRLGLSEIGSISLTQDYNESGDFTPQMDALTAINPSSVNIPVNRVNGITTVLSAPSGGLFPGTAVLIDLHGYTPQQMFAGFKGLVLNFPSTGRRGRFDRRKDEDIKKDSEKAMKRLNDIWDKAQLYARIDSTQRAQGKGAYEYQPEIQAIVPVVRGEMTLLIEVNQAKDIEAAIKWVTERKVKAIFTGVAEGWRVAEALAEANIPVVVGPILRNPSRASDRYDRPYANAANLHKAGVRVAIRTNEIENVRNLPYNAGFAAAYGLGSEAALRAVTLTPAEILGVADDYGSIEPGKVANIFVTNGDPFETKTDVVHLFIQGWKVPLESRHTLLYDEFLDRQPGLKKD